MRASSPRQIASAHKTAAARVQFFQTLMFALVHTLERSGLLNKIHLRYSCCTTCRNELAPSNLLFLLRMRGRRPIANFMRLCAPKFWTAGLAPEPAFPP